MKQFKIKSALFATAIMLVFSSCGGSKEKYTLVYNVNSGDTFEQLITTDVILNQNVMGQIMSVRTSMEMLAVYSINAVEENAIDMDFVFESIGMSMISDFFEMSFDSNTTSVFATEEDLSPMLKALTNLPFNMVVDRRGNVQSVSGLEQIMEAMVAVLGDEIDEQTKQQMLAQFDQQFSSESMQTTMGQSLTVFPEHPIRVGESWTTTTTVNAGVAMTTEVTTTLKSVRGNIAVLESKGEFSTDAPIVQNMHDAETQMTMTGTQSGTMEIDMNTGWVVGGEMVQNIKSEIDFQGMKIVQEIVSTTTIK